VLKQLLASSFLGVVRVADLEPSVLLSLGDVVSMAELGNNFL
jgi:hypothetical protein